MEGVASGNGDSSTDDSDSFESCAEDQDGNTRGLRQTAVPRVRDGTRKGKLPSSHASRHSYAEAVSGKEFVNEFYTESEQAPSLSPSPQSYPSYASVTSGRKPDAGFVQESQLHLDGNHPRQRIYGSYQNIHEPYQNKHEPYQNNQGSYQNTHGSYQSIHGSYQKVGRTPPDGESYGERHPSNYEAYQKYAFLATSREAAEISFGDFGDVKVEEKATFPPSHVSQASFAEAASGRFKQERMFPSAHHYPEEFDRGFEEGPQNQASFASYLTAEETGQDQSCICHHLMRAFQEWCRQTHGRHQSHNGDQGNSVIGLLNHLRNSTEELRSRQSVGGSSADLYAELSVQDPSGIPLCPSHGFPDISANSHCSECAEEISTLNALLNGDMTETKPPLDKETRKAITKANKTLVKMKEKVESAMKAVGEGDRHLDEMVKWMDAKKEETKRAFEDHVRRLHESIDHHFQMACQEFYRDHNDYRQRVMLDKQQVFDFASRLDAMQTEIQIKFAEIRAHGLRATQTVPNMVDDCNAVLSHEPQIQVVVRPEYNVVTQQASDQDIASLVGRVQLTDGDAAYNAFSYSTTPVVVDDAEPASDWSAVHKDDRDWSGGAELLDPNDPYYRYMVEKGDTSYSPLGRKDKHSAFMASTSSMASSVGEPGKMNNRKKKDKPQSKGAGLPFSSTERLRSKPQTLAVKEKVRQNTCKLKGPVPVAIAPTQNGKIWAVYGDRDPHLELLDKKGSVLKKIRVGGNARAVACLEWDRVVVALHSPSPRLSQIIGNGYRKDLVDLVKGLPPTCVSVGRTGLAVGSRTTLCWVTLSKWAKEWIVPQKNSPLKWVCATAVTFFNDNELICAADKEGKAVHFYMKDDDTGFTPLLSYFGAPVSPGEEAAAGFVPISLSAHPDGFLAILDSASNAVHVLNVEQGHQAVSVIPGKQLYRSNVPSLIAIGYTDGSDHLKLWAVTTSDDNCWVCQTRLKFQH